MESDTVQQNTETGNLSGVVATPVVEATPAKVEPPVKFQAQTGVPQANLLPILGFLGIGSKALGSNKTMGKIEAIYNWAKGKAGADGHADILWALRSLETDLRAAPLGKSRLDHLHEFVKIEGMARQFKQQQQELYRS